MINNLVVPEVRDLYAAIFGPSMLNSKYLSAQDLDFRSTPILEFSHSEQQEIYHWFEKLDKDPSPLLKFLEAQNTAILGARFEALWQYFVNFFSGYTWFISNLQVTENGTTKGEFDLLIQCHEKYWHLELALKYYLLAPPYHGTELTQWIGPQCRDRFDIKLDKTLGKQLHLSQTEAGAAALKEVGVKEIHPVTLMRGWLFTPLNPSIAIDSSLHDAIDPDHNKGYWLKQQELDLLKVQPFSWYNLPKHKWISPLLTTQTPMSYTELKDLIERHFAENRFGLMIVGTELTTINNNPNYHLEACRYLIVPDDWPYN